MLEQHNSVYTLGWNEKPRSLHLALYPDFKTRGDILHYMRATGLTGWPHQSESLQNLHCTLLYSGSLLAPFDFPKEQPLKHPVDLSGIKWPVKPLALQRAKEGSPIAILFSGSERLRHLSDLFHKKFNLTVNPSHYIFHMTLSKIQEFRPRSKQYEKTKFKSINDYFYLPPYSGRMVLTDLKLAYDHT